MQDVYSENFFTYARLLTMRIREKDACPLNLRSMELVKRGNMSDYQKMYYMICDAASRALDALPDTPANRAARELLEKALLEAEELYIETAEE